MFVDALAVSPQQVAAFVSVAAALFSCEDHFAATKITPMTGTDTANGSN